MNPLTKQAINEHLSKYNMNPQPRETDDPADCWLFDLAENIQSELYCYEPEADDLTAVMMTSVQLKPSENATTLAAAISPALAPASIIAMDDILSLRIMLRGDRESIGPLIDEGIMISRHIMGAVFTKIVELAENKITLQQAMMSAMKELQQPNQGQEAANEQDSDD